MASKRHVRRNTCDGKRAHQTVEDARVAMGKLYRKQIFRQMLNVYRCPFCAHFHVGHPPRKKKKRGEFK